VETGTASRSKLNTNETKNLSMNIKPNLNLQRNGMRGINSGDIVLKTIKVLCDLPPTLRSNNSNNNNNMATILNCKKH